MKLAPPSKPRTGRLRWAVLLGVAVLAAILSPLVAALTLGAGAAVLYPGVLLLLAAWNAWVVVDLVRGAWWSRRSGGPLTVHVLLFGLAVPSAVLFGLGFDLPARPKSPLLIAAGLGLLYSVLVLGASARRSKRDYFAPVFNGFAFLFYVAYAAAEGTGQAPGGVYAFSRTVALLQIFDFHFFATFGPIFVLPAFLPKLKGLRWPAVATETGGPDVLLARAPRARPVVRATAKIVSKAAGAFVAYTAVAYLVWFPIGYAGVSSFQALDVSDLPHVRNPNATFAATAGSLTDVVRPPPNWRELVSREVNLSRTLGLTHLRFDLKTEFLHDNASLAALDVAVAAWRANGLGAILNPFGADTWVSAHPTFEALNATIADDAEFLAGRYQPDWIFPFFEPNGQVAVNLGHGMPTEAWVGAIESAAVRIRAASPATRILIEIADDPQGPELFAALQASSAPIDALGFDLYPGSAFELDRVGRYAALARNGTKAFWIPEFGLDSIQFGEDAQARFVATLVSRASVEWNVTGFCVWALEDNTGVGMDQVLRSGLGITALDGRAKPAFFAYRDGIAAIR